MTSNDNISIRARIRKASTSINPEFGPATDALLTFVSSGSSSSWNKRSDASIVLSPLSLLSGAHHPHPSANNSTANSYSNSNNGNGNSAAWRSASPLRSHSAPRARGLSSSQRNRSFNRGHPPLLVRHSSPANAARSNNNNGSSSSDGGDLTNSNDKFTNDETNENDMVDISLEEEETPVTIELESQELTNKNNNTQEEEETRQDNNNNNTSSTLPPSTTPLPIVRSGSGLSMPAIIGGPPLQQQQPQRSNTNSTCSTNSLSSRSNSLPRSRSINDRSRSINKNRRARSRNRSSCSGGGGGSDSLCSSSGRQRSSRPTSNSRAGSNGRPLSRGNNAALSLSHGRRMRSAGAANIFNTISVVCNDDEEEDVLDSSLRFDEEMMITEEMSVALKDVISVRHETPTSSSLKSATTATTGTTTTNGTTTTISMAPLAMTRVGSFTPPIISPPTPLYRPGSKLSTTTQSLTASAHPPPNSYRIYIHTRMNGYLEFEFDKNSNSYEVVLAYLRCHLREGMVPPDHHNVVDVSSDGGGLKKKKKKGLEESIALTRTKSITPKHAIDVDNDDDDDDDEDTVTSTSTASTSSHHHQQDSLPLTPTEPPLITRSNSSNPIERLQTKAINRQLQQEEAPMNRISGWFSSIMDCGFNCCQDTTVTPEDKTVYYYGGIQSTTPLRGGELKKKKSGQSQSVSPRSRVLKKSGIGGLSFEVETVTSNMSGYY